ncbi:MAG: methyltransferase domain-containing protein [Chloroflexi bacterium]|nr:methyltransferase domain-containing protein [Chloroflexota bacterium]
MATVARTLPWYLNRHKVASALRSTWRLLFLPKEQQKRFFDSFDVFSMEWEARLADNPGDFRETSRKVADWYSVVNLLCSIGQIEKMYIPPRLEAGKSVHHNQLLYERMLAEDLRVGPGDTVLELGCGRGRVAYHVHSLTGAGLVGYNVDESQVRSAKDFARQRRADSLCQFHVRDLNDVPYPLQDGSIAGVYEIGAICYSTDLSRLFKDVHRVLRPGGRVSLLDICMHDQYDPANPEHVRLLSKTKPLVGLLRALHWHDYQRAFHESGLKVVKNENPSIDGLMVPMIEYLNRYFVLAERVTKVGTRLRLLPAHLSKLLTRFNEEGEAFVAFDRGRLGTIAQYIVAEKPH